MPPARMPSTAVDRAGGGCGPAAPENRPPAESPAGRAARDAASSGPPAVKVNGSAMVRFPPSRRADREDATSMPRNRESKWTVTVSPGRTGGLLLPGSVSSVEYAPSAAGVYASRGAVAAAEPRRGLSSFLKLFGGERMGVGVVWAGDVRSLFPSGGGRAGATRARVRGRKTKKQNINSPDRLSRLAL